MKLRPMKISDAKLMFKWKNYPETRRFALLTHKKIKLADHLRWLKNNLQHFQIINDNMGAIRVQDKEVSIWIDRKYWGQGLATEAIKKVSKKGYTAKIVVDNIASQKVFIKNGFRPIYAIWTKK
jgi:RimJ/RimL family protein N-acetyltransferase